MPLDHYPDYVHMGEVAILIRRLSNTSQTMHAVAICANLSSPAGQHVQNRSTLIRVRVRVRTLVRWFGTVAQCLYRDQVFQ